MDAFYAAVEVHDRPELEGKPVIVGGQGPRGVVATANYPARRFGVHSAMPMARARRLCPDGVFLQGRMQRYRQVSQQVFGVFHHYTPLVEGLSLDEAFLDVSASLRLFGEARQIAISLKAAIRAATGLTASVGVAHNKFLAKLASDLEKPDGLVCVDPARVQAFLDPMPIRRLWGIGPKTAPRLQALGILTFGQLRKTSPAVLQPVLGNRTDHFLQLARGEDERPVVAESADKSISHEQTFDQDLVADEDMHAVLQRLSEAVAQRLRQRGLGARTVSVKIRDASFQTVSRSRSMPTATSGTMTIYRLARALFGNWRQQYPRTPVRLLGVGASGLEDAAALREETGAGLQLDTLARPEHKLDSVLDAINQRYGDAKIAHGLTLRRSASAEPGDGEDRDG